MAQVVAGNREGHAAHCAFAHGIRIAVLETGVGGDGSEVNDDTATLRDHCLNRLPHGVVGSENVYAEDAFKIFVTGVVEPSYMRHARAVDKDVYTGELQNRLEYLFCLCRIGNIACMRSRGSTELRYLCHRFLRCFSVDVYDADDSTMLGEAESDRLADTAGAACNQRHFVVQTKTVHDVAPIRDRRKAGMAASTFYLV